MKRTVLFEALILWGIGIVSSIEALRLIYVKIPGVLYDKLGPGYFILMIGVALTVTGTCHFFSGQQKGNSGNKAKTDGEAVILVVNTIVASAGYIFLINIFGYALSTFLFFIAQLWIFGVRLWKTNIVLALIFTTAYFLIFVEFCTLIFPRGYLIPLFD